MFISMMRRLTTSSGAHLNRKRSIPAAGTTKVAECGESPLDHRGDGRSNGISQSKKTVKSARGGGKQVVWHAVILHGGAY